MNPLGRHIWRGGRTLLFALVLSAALGACSSSDDDSGSSRPSAVNYTGLTTQAEITQANAESLMLGTYNGTSGGLGADLPLAVEADVENDIATAKYVADVALDLMEDRSQRALPVAATQQGDCGGTASYPDNENATSGLITFNDYCVTDGLEEIVMDGSVWIETTETSATLHMDLRVTGMGESVRLRMSMYITEDSNGASTFTVNFQHTDGNVYRIVMGEFDINTDTSGNMSISDMRLYHPEYGYVDIQTNTAIMAGQCSNGNPSSGEIQASGANDSRATLTFSDCDTYMVCVTENQLETCDTYSW
jgi:hypothetical protein